MTAAETLRDKGYEEVVLLEREAFAGGKCRTVEYEGRNYELGAGIIAANYATIMGLVDKYAIPLSPIAFSKENLYDLATGGLHPDTFSFPERVSFFWQLLLHYRRLSLQFPEVLKPGHSQCEPELYDNFHHWATMNHIPLVEDRFERYFTGFGYGYWDEIPAAYVLKYNDWASLVSYIRRAVYIFPEGIQRLWQKIAAHHHVSYNTTINRIVREGGQIGIDTDKGSFNADVLLLTCPLDETLLFMDASSEEQALFSKIRYVDYRTYVCRLKDFPQQTGFIPAHFSPSGKGHPVFWYKRYADSDIYTIYVLSDFTVPDDIILKNMENSIHSLGGQLIKVEQVVKWKYFPHVGTEEMQDGFYRRLEALQGVNNTFYAGELLNFSTVELTAAYAKDLMNRFF